MKNTCINSCQNGYGTELSSILQGIEEQTFIPADQMKAHFWDMFIVDALLGIQEMEAVLDDESEINKRIQQTPGLLPIQRDFYGIMIRAQKEQILDCGMERLLRVREQQCDGPVFNYVSQVWYRMGCRLRRCCTAMAF